jgi:hypothetical protein
MYRISSNLVKIVFYSIPIVYPVMILLIFLTVEFTCIQIIQIISIVLLPCTLILCTIFYLLIDVYVDKGNLLINNIFTSNRYSISNENVIKLGGFGIIFHKYIFYIIYKNSNGKKRVGLLVRSLSRDINNHISSFIK